MCSVNWGIFSTSGDVQYIGGMNETKYLNFVKLVTLLSQFFYTKISFYIGTGPLNLSCSLLMGK